MNTHEINDIRTSTDFKSVTFSNFKKSEVKKQLLENLKKSRIEPACYWTAELICAGHYKDIWEIIFYYMSKFIHLGNPKLAIYLERRYDLFDSVVKQKHYYDTLQLRNFDNIRRLFAEIISVLALSNKKHSIEQIKINRMEEFDMNQMTERLKAPDTTYLEDVFQPKDPKELTIPINELSFCLSRECQNATDACYWIEWILEFDTHCKKNGEPCFCEKRNYKVEHKLRGDIIWMIWDVIWIHCNETEDEYLIAVMNSLCNLFCVNYTIATPKKRRFMLYFAVSLLIEPSVTTTEVFNDKPTIQNAVDNINKIYEQIKMNEFSPQMDYLFHPLNDSMNDETGETMGNKCNAFNNTVKKMEMMNKMDFI